MKIIGALMFVLIACVTIANAEAVFFEDNFGGSTLNPAKWNTTHVTSGNRWCDNYQGPQSGPGAWLEYSSESCKGTTQSAPYGQVTFSNGVMTLQSISKRAFPFIRTGPPQLLSPFPSSGDFTFEMKFKYDNLQTNMGTGFHLMHYDDYPYQGTTPPYGSNSVGQGIFGFWDNLSRVDVGMVGQSFSFTISEALQWHTFRLEYKKGEYSLFLDNQLKLGPVKSSLRPNSIDFGNSVAAWWWPATWSGMSIDYVRVLLPDQTTEIPPGTIPSLPPSPVITKFGELTSTGSDQFNENQDLFVISHGWNTSDPVNTNLPLWEVAMAIDLKNKSGISGGNVLKWNWQEKAQSDDTYNPITGGNLLSDSSLVQKIMGVPYDKVRDSGKHLANAIRTYLQNEGAENHTGSIHMIGHSLGSGVIIQAALRLTDDHDGYVNYNVRQLTLLDSPWYVFAPSIQQIKLRDFFIDNYYTLLGRPQGYGFADVNVWIDNLYSKLVGNLNLDQISNGHQLAHQWYRSSINNFQDSSVIGFDNTVPASTKQYGYYWHDHQGEVPPNMFHYFGEPYWKLRKGVFQTTGEYITDAANALSELKQETKDTLETFAISSAISVTIVAAETLNKLADTVEYVTDVAGHALWAYNATTGNGYLKLVLNSEALASVPITIPAEATSMQFNYNFSTGCDSKTQLDVYLNDTLVFTALAEDVLGTDGQFSGWINVTDHAGQQVDMTYRLSNPVDGPLGEIALDDIIFAKLASLEMQINTGFPWPMFLPAITGSR